jgi:sugar phosphate isomerase/epimerase
MVCTENVNNFQLPFVGNAIDDLCELEHFYLTWDIGHDAMTDFEEQKVLLRHQGRIKHMHLHDYNGMSDHQIPGTGQLDIEGMLRFAHRHRCSVLVETKTAVSLTESVKVVQKLLDTMWI